MWRPDGEQLDEVAKIRWEVVPYMRGECLDLGCGPNKVFPHFTGVDSGKDSILFGIQMRPDLKADVANLKKLASGEYDCVFSSHVLEHIDDYHAALKEWFRLVRKGGYLCLYLPHADLYPQTKGREEWKAWIENKKDAFANIGAACEQYRFERERRGAKTVGEQYAGTPYANPDHKHDFRPADITAAMKKIGGGFDLIECQERNGGDEYSFFMVFKKISSGVKESWKEPRPAKTVAVVRYGAQGDNIQASSILPWFKENDYHVTFYCQSGLGHEVIKNDPNIDRFIVQDKDAVPPQVLNQFWDNERKKYTKWVNLCESVEGTLLASPGSAKFEWPNEMRAKYLDVNYLEFTHELAGVPAPYRPQFYSTADEREWARKQASGFGKRNILWSLAGSSGHKMWPHLDAVIARVMIEYKDVHVVLVGDESCQILEGGWGQEKRVHCQSGKWSIRQSLAFCEAADVIIGTETGLLNAAGGMEVPKIITLSHSSAEMLTKHWKAVTVLTQAEGIGCAKHPCRQLHGGGGTDVWQDCPQEPATGAALCQYHVGAETMWEALAKVLGPPDVIPIRKAA